MSPYLKRIFFILGLVAFACVMFAVVLVCSRLSKANEEFDQAIDSVAKDYYEKEAIRLNAFIDAGASVEIDGIAVETVTADVVEEAKSILPRVEPLLGEGYVMLVNGVLELHKDATLDDALKYYCPYEVDVTEKIIVLREK